jgi:beta-N-acetylhexosaminidase
VSRAFNVSDLAHGVIVAGFPNERIADLPAFGGYIIFARNGTSAADVRAVTDALRERHAALPPIVAVDQEGGSVVRIRSGVEPMPSMMAVGAASSVELAEHAGEQIAFDLRRAGCTMNLAPVLDLSLESQNAVIGTRSIGSDPSAVGKLGQSLALGLERYGVGACFKHFPGHGSTATDSHDVLPVVDEPAETLRSRDIVPFAMVAATARAVMGAHVLFRTFDDRPATRSARLVGEVLRGELGFDGAFLTDCLEMGAAGDAAAAGIDALRAGADLLLVSHNLDVARAVAESIERAVESGSLTLERLQEAHARVLRLRSATPPLPMDAFPPHPGIGRELARRAITLIRGLPHADPTACCSVEFLPVETQAERLLAGNPRRFAPRGAAEPKVERLSGEAPALEELTLGLDASAAEVDAAIDRIENSRRRPIVLARRAHLHPAQARAIARVVGRFPDAVVVSMREPFDLPLFAAARHVLAAYGDDDASVGALADVLFGGVMPQGRLPVAF